MLNIVLKALAILKVGIKAIKYFIDSSFRTPVTPVPGSVLYCDLWVAVEHSGIYLGDDEIVNIEVDGFADSVVRRSAPRSFTSKSILGAKIYVSCDGNGAVGSEVVGETAAIRVGERSFYGLVFKNCHTFSTKCLDIPSLGNHSTSSGNGLLLAPIDHSVESWEPTIKILKATAHRRLGATKWRLWDWDHSLANNPAPEPDWQAQEDYFKNLPLDEEAMSVIRTELAEWMDYEAELADEKLPDAIRSKLKGYGRLLTDISQTYDNAKPFLAACPGAILSYKDLKACSNELGPLTRQLQENKDIKELARKMGRAYISEEKKKQRKLPEASKSEVYGTYRSNDLMRLLPTELVNLDDEALETLFYARFLEKKLMTYELQGVTFAQGEELENQKKRTGPVVACLDTSGSMNGTPLLKAKALLLAISAILQQERRSLHVLLFGDSGELREFAMVEENNTAGLLHFLSKEFGSGTDFETPLRRACEIIECDREYEKADILMISDGDCDLSTDYLRILQAKKQALDCSVYSVLCHGRRVADSYSDEVVVL